MSRFPRTEPGPELWLGQLQSSDKTPADVDLLNAIALKTYEVRALQIAYFKDRSGDVLNACKLAERQLDDLIRRPAQGGLF